MNKWKHIFLYENLQNKVLLMDSNISKKEVIFCGQKYKYKQNLTNFILFNAIILKKYPSLKQVLI
jgi:hypothetical protein